MKKKSLHRPGIEPGPPAWQASILPLNQRCLHNVDAEFLDNKQLWFNLALASCFGCTEKASSLQGYPKDLSIKELKDVQCGPSMTSWVDPYPFNELVHTLYWVDPYPFIEGMDQLLNKRVWTQYIIDGPHCMY